jgi:hypothetical protein
MTDGRQLIRQISGNLKKFQAGTGELRYSTPKAIICQGFGADLKVLNTLRRRLTGYFD